MIIAIDGTSGSGKSTLAKKLAKNLNFGFFSAGELYRAIAYKVLEMKIDENDDERLKFLIENTSVNYYYNGERNIMLVDNIDITDNLHTEEVSNFVSKISHKPFIREFVRKLQRATTKENENIVMEGRDIGSVIFPDADIKIYVDCKVEARAERRMSDYRKLGEDVSIESVIEALKERDYNDTHRELSPLVMSKNSLLIDTTTNNVETCLKLIYNELIKRNLIDIEYLKSRNISL